MTDVTLSIIIVNWNTREITRDCLRSIVEQVHDVSYEVIVIDNASSDGSADMIRHDFPDFALIANDANVGFGRANNQGMRVARSQYFLLLNSDTLVIDDAVQRFTAFMAREPRIGIAGCKLLFEDRTLQHSCYRFPSLGLAVLEELLLYKLLSRRRQGEVLLTGYWTYDHTRDVNWVMGAAMLLRREVFEQTGGFDERLFMYGEEMEWCMRVRDKGWRITFTPDFSIIHLNHKSADLKYGDERMDICHKRLYDIYRQRSGTVAMSTLFLIKTFGALFRACYFRARARGKRGGDDYLESQARYHSQSLRYHLRTLAGGSLARGSTG